MNQFQRQKRRSNLMQDFCSGLPRTGLVMMPPACRVEATAVINHSALQATGAVEIKIGGWTATRHSPLATEPLATRAPQIASINLNG
jgi:hypothetical protein